MQEQTWDDQLEDIVFHLQRRQTKVKRIIQKYVTRHASVKNTLVPSGTFVSIPGAGLITLVATFMVQSPVMFQLMAEEIAQVYQASPSKNLSIPIKENEPLDASGLVLSSLPDEFTHELSNKLINKILINNAIKRLLLHYIPVVTLETFIEWLPLPNGIASTPTNTLIALQLIRRIGVLLASYFENGQQWIGGNSARTNDVLQNYGYDYASVDDIPFIPEMCEGIVTRLLAQSHTIYEQSGEETYQEIRRLLINILRLKFARTSFSISE